MLICWACGTLVASEAGNGCLCCWLGLKFTQFPVPCPGEDVSRMPASNCTFNPRTFQGRRMAVPKETANCTNGTVAPPGLELLHDNIEEFLTGFLSTRLIPAAHLLAMAVGIPSNAAILLCLSSRTRVCSATILYLSLATSDLLLLLALAFRVHYNLHGNDWVFGEAACKLVTACFYGNIYCSIHAIMCISGMRYMAVVHPFFYRGLSKHICTTLASLAVWVVFAVAMVPEFLIQQTYRIETLGITTCHDVLPYDSESYRFLMPYRLTLIVLGFIVPAAVIALSYGSIIRQLGRSSCDWTLYIRASSLVFVIFVLCFTPSSVMYITHYISLASRGQDHFYSYYSVAVCLCCFHSCLDPFLSYSMAKTTSSNLHLVTFKRKPLGVTVSI
uniref:G-protein coupled receptors family 1 profile domain-containing protein n=1 Tax=Denticeps clupeoides TaxID=299321 RepID=A0AAY4BFN7_9TELE